MILRACRLRNSSKVRLVRSISASARSRMDGQLLVHLALTGLQLGILGPFRLHLGQLVLEGLEATVEVEVTGPLDLVELVGQLRLQAGQVDVTLLLIDEGHKVGGEVDDLLQLLGLQLLPGFGAHEQVGQPAAGTPQVPDVHDGSSQLDMAHALAPHLRTGDLDAAPLADDAAEANPLVLAAIALPVLGWTEDLLAEKPVLFRDAGSGS